MERLGRTLTGEIYLRKQEGPWPPAIKKSVTQLNGHEVICSFNKKIPMVEVGPDPRFKLMLDPKSLEIIAEVLEKYGRMTNSKIKTAAYLTAPMRRLLKLEKEGKDTRNVPVIGG